MRIIIAILAAIVWIAGVRGQSRPAPTPKQTSVVAPGHSAIGHRRSKPAVAKAGVSAPDDAVLEARIREKLSRSKLGSDRVLFTVRGGVVTFEGETSVIQRKGSATRIAHSAGALRVENHIRLSEEARRKASANLAKGRRRAQVVRGLRRDQR